MSAEKRSLRLLGTRLSSIFNHDIAQEKRSSETHQRPLSAPKLSNGQRKMDDKNLDPRVMSQSLILGLLGLNSVHNSTNNPNYNQSSSPPTPPSHARNTDPIQDIPSNRHGPQNLDSYPLTLSPSKSQFLAQSPRTPKARKPPPGDEAELDSRTASPPSISRDAFADMKSLVGNELDHMMSSYDDKDNLYVVTVSEEPTSPLRVEPREYDSYLPKETKLGLKSHLPRESDEAMDSETPFESSLQNEGFLATNESERPLLYVNMPSGVYGSSSYYDSDRQASPLSPELHFSESSRSATPQMFTSLNTTETLDPDKSLGANHISNGNRIVHSMVNTDLHGAVNRNKASRSIETPGSLSSPMRPPGQADSLWTESIYSDTLELPVDSFAESGIHSFAQSNFQTRGVNPNSETQDAHGSQLYQSSQLDFTLGSESSATDTLPQRNKLGLLQMWPQRAHSFSDMANSSQILASSSIRKSHTRVSSTSSILSGSSRHVNLALIKRTFTLRPGEGERSNYVTTIRKSAGTSYNEAGPGKWKLPLGIMPMDSKNMALQSYTQSTTRFSRGASSLNARSKRSSGVELKHGHLQPRLLAAEIDEVGDTNRFGSLGRSSTLQNKALTPVLSTISKSENLSNQSAQSSQVSRSGSLTRSSTLSAHDVTGSNGVGGAVSGNGTSSIGAGTASSLGAGNGLGVGGSVGGSGGIKSRRASGSSFAESLGSVADGRVDAYYQHQGYRYDEMDDDYNEYNEVESYEDDEGDEKPHLVLANPDSSSDNE